MDPPEPYTQFLNRYVSESPGFWSLEEGFWRHKRPLSASCQENQYGDPIPRRSPMQTIQNPKPFESLNSKA